MADKPKPLLPAPLMKAEHIAPFDAMIQKFIRGYYDNPDDALWYYATVMNFDTVPAAILPYLAVMIGVDGIKGWNYATTEALQRQTLKNAILMKRRHGTVWALKTALENAGFSNIVINDHLFVLYFNGTWTFNGSNQFNSNLWAEFTITMDPPIGVLPQNVDIPTLMLLINYWKRKCTLLVGLSINNLVIISFGIGNQTGLYFDGTWNFDGTNQFTG